MLKVRKEKYVAPTRLRHSRWAALPGFQQLWHLHGFVDLGSSSSSEPFAAHTKRHLPYLLHSTTGTENNGNTEFKILPEQLKGIRSLQELHELGGLRRLEFGLRTDQRTGLSLDETTINQKRIGRVAVSKLWHGEN